MVVQLVRVVVLSLALAHPAMAASTLATAAAALSAGSWTSITPSGKSTVDASLVTSYGASASYDVIRRQINFVGSTHPQPYDHILYDDTTNAYLDGTLFSGVPASTNFVGHGFDGNTSDPRTGDVFYLCRTGSCGGNYIYKKAYNSTTWTALAVNPLSPNETNSDAAALTYFPEMNALIVIVPSGRVYKCVDPCTSTGNWSLVGTTSPTGSYAFAEYNQARGFVLLGSVANDFVYTLSSAGTLASKAYFASDPYTGSGYNGNVVADPVSGVFIVTNGVSAGTSTHTCTTYDVTPSTSATTGSCTSPPAGLTGSSVSVALRHYGVIAYIHCGDGCGSSTLNIYLYKHAASEQATNDYAVRCSHPSVLQCNGFESTAETVHNTFVFPDGGGTFRESLDTSVKASGASSLKFNLPAGSSSPNISGYWRSAAWSQTFSQNSTFYAQYRFRITSSMLTNLSQWNSQWKIAILHYEGVTCGGIELTHKVRSNSNRFLEAYTGCGTPGLYLDDGTNIWLQQGANPKPTGDGYWCPYPAPNGSDCFYLTGETWYTVYWKVQIGTWGAANSTVQAWMATDGGSYQQIINLSNFTLSSNGTPSQGYNRMDFLPYMTSLSTSASSSADIWYDEWIVSTGEIAAPGVAAASSPADTTPPSAPIGIMISDRRY